MKINIHQYMQIIDDDLTKPYRELIETLEVKCPQCKRGDNSLIIFFRRDKLFNELKKEVTSTMQIGCMCCNWKTIRDFKWKTRF